MGHVNLRGETARALLQLTREQFSFLEEQLRNSASGNFPASHAMHYWYIMSTLALDGDDAFRLPKKKAEDALPRHKPETGRKYLAECEKLGFTCTVKTMGKRYVELTKAGQLVVASTLTRWMSEVAKVRRASESAAPRTAPADESHEIETG